MAPTCEALPGIAKCCCFLHVCLCTYLLFLISRVFKTLVTVLLKKVNLHSCVFLQSLSAVQGTIIIYNLNGYVQ